MPTEVMGNSVKCISFQLSRIRFLTAPECHLDRAAVITGSWMEEVNRLCIWRYNCSGLIEEGRLRPISEAEDGISAGVLGDSADDPRLICSVVHPGWVQDLKVDVHRQQVLSASSHGCLHLYSWSSLCMDDSSPDRLHRLTCDTWMPFGNQQMFAASERSNIALSCICFSLDGCHAIVGDDLGRLAAVDLNRAPPPSDSGSPSSEKRQDAGVLYYGSDIVTVNALELVDTSSLVSVNQLGQLKVWDARVGLGKPQQRLLRPGKTLPLYSISRHPGQSHLLAVGGVGQPGSAAAYIWDLRATQYPLTEVACDGQSVWELAFHPCQPRHLYLATETAGLLRISCRGETDSWTGFKGSRRKLTVASALGNTAPIDTMISFDLCYQHLVCAHSNSTMQTAACDAYAY